MVRIIDGHCHVGKGFEKRLEPEELLEIMDRNNVEKTVICPLEQYISVFNEEGNSYILDIVRKHPGRFIGFAAVNPWYMEKGVDMLKKYLDKGMKGIKFNPKLQGFVLNSALVKPYIEVAENYRVPVYFHTGTMINSEPFQLHDLAQDFPSVNFIMGHSGNTDLWTDVHYSVKGVRNIYLDTSHNLGIRNFIDMAGADRVIFSSNMPRSHQTFELKTVMNLDLSMNELERVCYQNMAGLVGEKI